MLKNKVEIALILCGGMGTRMAPITTIIAKEMLPLNCRPAIWYTVNNCINSGINEIIIVISHRKENLKKFLEESFPKTKFNFIYQTIINGTANAVLLCKNKIKKRNFLFINGDDLVEDKTLYQKLINSFQGKTVIHIHKIKENEMDKFGVFEIDNNKNITRVFEKPLPTQTKSRLGGYCALVSTNEVFDYIKFLKPNKKNELVFTDVFSYLAKENKLKCLVDNKIKIYSVGDKLEYARANLYFTEKNI